MQKSSKKVDILLASLACVFAVIYIVGILIVNLRMHEIVKKCVSEQ